jgi:hypothetical protein
MRIAAQVEVSEAPAQTVRNVGYGSDDRGEACGARHDVDVLSSGKATLHIGRCAGPCPAS